MGGEEPRRRRARRMPIRSPLLLIIAILAYTLFARTRLFSTESQKVTPSPRLAVKDIPRGLQPFQDCSICNIFVDTKLDFLTTAHGLVISEFVSRRDRLAEALVKDGLDAFAVEPGYTFQYYANISQ